MNNQASKCQCTNFDLPNELLLEIFYRLPTFESVVRCKSVCKHWLNLITEPGFDAQYIAYRSIAYLSNTNSSSERDEQPLQNHPHRHVFCIRRYHRMKPFNYPNRSSYTCLDSVLSFIPAYQQHVDSLAIKSWCNDLVLCTSALPKELELYICNPRTRQYIQLPPPSNREQNCLAGFTWDPYYVFDKDTDQVTLNTDCRYCVCYAVPSLYPSSTLEMEVLSSESETRGVWMKAELRTLHRFNYIMVDDFNCFTYNGMLHFYNLDAIVGFDPCKIIDGVIRGHIIQMPPYDLVNANYNRSVSVGVFGEKLLLVEYRSRKLYPEVDITEVSIEQNTAYAITVWELENYNNGEWSMKHMIYLHDFVSNDSVLSEHIKRGCPISKLLYMYPNNADIVLLMFRTLVVECNVKRKTLKKVCGFRRFLPKVYGLAFPWWPSPLPLSI